MNYNVFFGSYLSIVLMFWTYLIVLWAKKKLAFPVLVTWMTAGSNIVGIVVFFLCRNKFIQ